MVQFFDEIPDNLLSWIPKQQVFWVASAPLTPDGHVNLSPKGVAGTFHIVDSHTVWYEDLTGSGIETISHIRENGRITVLFNAFEGPPRIARLFGKGTVYDFGTPEYEKYLPPEKRQAGSRAVIFISVYKVSTSCGYAVPFYDFKGHRKQLLEWADRREQKSTGDTLPGYWEGKNSHSLDGLPGLQPNLPEDNIKFQHCPIEGRHHEEPFLQKLKGNVTDSKFLLGCSAGALATVLLTRFVVSR